jgi:hypothetical protein
VVASAVPIGVFVLRQDRASTSYDEALEKITELELELAQAKLKLAQYEVLEVVAVFL